MFDAHLNHPVGALAPEQLAMLQRVFDDACEASGIKKGTSRAEGLAAVLMKLYNSGIRDQTTLENMLSDVHRI
ncbi:hypothetical protein M0654_08475 [Rhizobium sp. NTR19]|jgi:hypothetical protein|uniref:Uncharacterized protein n=1 Tax=Neorhizobium turbinariae TaxID=2937795 RepID=A0ABT0IQ95_9HYPH|nr:MULTISPECIES: hypothetical protein [Neorhizobium]MCK8780018.1 hypothetical protein [Neorhizobium turbinariae]